MRVNSDEKEAGLENQSLLSSENGGIKTDGSRGRTHKYKSWLDKAKLVYAGMMT